MIETLTLDTRKGYSPGGKLRISPLRRGERNNVTLSVAVSSDRRPYDLAGMTAHLVWQAADGKLGTLNSGAEGRNFLCPFSICPCKVQEYDVQYYL